MITSKRFLAVNDRVQPIMLLIYFILLYRPLTMTARLQATSLRKLQEGHERPDRTLQRVGVVLYRTPILVHGSQTNNYAESQFLVC